MKKNTSRLSASTSLKSSFGNTKATTSNASYNRSNSSSFSSSSGSAFGKPSAFKRSVSVGGSGFNCSRDKKPSSDNNSWKTNKPKFEKIASTKPVPESWGANKAKFEKSSNSGSKYCNDGSWTTSQPKPTNTASKCSNNNNFVSAKPNYKNSLSVGSQFSTENCWASVASKNEKSGSILPSGKSTLTSTNKTAQKATVDYSYSPAKKQSDKSAFVSSYSKGLLEKSNFGLLSSTVISSSPSLVSEKSKYFSNSQQESLNKSNKAAKDIYSCSVNENFSKPKAQTSSYFDAVQSMHVKKKSLNGGDSLAKHDSKISCHSTKEAAKTSNGSEKNSHNDHHFYNNLSKLFHLKGSSHSKYESNTSQYVNPILHVPKEINKTAFYGPPLVHVESCNATRNLDFQSHESMIKGKSTSNKDSKLKNNSRKTALSGNYNYEMPSGNSCTKVTIFGSAVSDANSHASVEFGSNMSDSQLLTSHDIHVQKMHHGIGFNKHIFGHLFAKHSLDKKAKHSDDNACNVPFTTTGESQINSDLNQLLFNGKIKESVGCKAKGDTMQDTCDWEAQKSSWNSSNGASNPLISKAKSNKSGSFKEFRSPTTTSQDSQRKFHNEEKTKVIAELLKSYCKQQGNDVCIENGLKSIKKIQAGSNEQHDGSIDTVRNVVDNIHFSYSSSGGVENRVTANPASLINQRLNIQSTNATNINDDSNLSPSISNNRTLKNSCKESLKADANIKCSSLNHLEANDQINIISVDNHNSMSSDLHNFSHNKSAKENDCFVQIPTISSPNCNGARRKVIPNAEISVTPANSSCTSAEFKNGHLNLFKSSNILSSFSHLTHAISTGPLKKSCKDQQRNNPKRKVCEASSLSANLSTNNNFAFTSSGITHGGIIPTLENSNHQASNFQNSQPTKKTSKCNKNKYSPFVEMHNDHAFPFMVNTRGHHIPVSSHARDAILTALMFSSVNSNRKKACSKQQRSVIRREPQQFRSHPNSIGLSAIGLALPRASSQPNPLETQWEESDDSDGPLSETPHFMIPSSQSENDLEHKDYFSGSILDSHTVDDFRNSYEKVTKVINHGRELLVAENYLQACVEFEVGLKLMDCILESKIDDSDMSALDKTICKSVQEVIRVDRKSALEGYSDAQAGYVAPRQEQHSQALPDGAPSAPPSYTDVLREDLEKNLFSCGSFCTNVNQQIAKELSSTDGPSAPSAELCDTLPSSPPSYELHESVLQIEDTCRSNILNSSSPKMEPVQPTNPLVPPASTLNPDSGDIQRSNPVCVKIIERESQSLIAATQTNKISALNGFVNSVPCNLNVNVENIVNDGSAACKQPKCQVLASSLSMIEGKSHTTAETNCKSRFTVCPCSLTIEKPKSLDSQKVNECCKVPKCAQLSHDEQNLTKELKSKPEGCEECTETNVKGPVTCPKSTVDVQKTNEKETLLLDNRSNGEELIKDLTILPSKSLNASGFGSSETTTQHKNYLVNGKLPPTPPPFSLEQVFPSRQLPSFPPTVSTSKCLAFPPDVEVLKENSSDIANLKPQKTEQKSDLTKALNETEIENIYSFLKDCHTPINDCQIPNKVYSIPVLDGKLGEFSLLNNETAKKVNNIQESECESKLLSSGNATLSCTQQITSPDRTIVLDPFLFEDPFVDGCFNCHLGDEEDEPFRYDDQICEFSSQENSKQELEIIFAPICSLECCDDESPLVTCFTKCQNNESGLPLVNNSSTEIMKKKFSKVSNLSYNNMETYQRHDELPPTYDSSVSRSSKSPTMESFYTTTSKTPELNNSELKLYETNKMCLNQTYGHYTSVGSHEGIIAMAKEPESLNGTDPSIRTEHFFISDTTDGLHSRVKNEQIKITELNLRKFEGNAGDKRTISHENCQDLENLSQLTSQEGTIHCNSERKEDALPNYQNVNQEKAGLEQIYEEINELPTKKAVDDDKDLSWTNGGSSPLSVTTFVVANSVATSVINKDPSPNSFNSKLETNIKKGLKSLSIPYFIYNKTNRQSSDEGRLIGQSSFFIDFENENEGGGEITVMSLEDVRVYFMDSTQNITSPSSNQTIAVNQRTDKKHREGSICLEIGKKLWLKYLNVASTKVLKTINKIYVVEEKPDSYFAIQLSSKTKFSAIDQFEEILKKNSNYQIEALAKSKSLNEHRKIINKMESFIKEKSPAFYIQTHDLTRKSTRAVQNAAASISRGIMNFHSSKLAIRDTPSTSPLTMKLHGQMKILQTKGRLLEEAQWKNSVVFI